MRRHVNIVYTPIMHICESQFRFVEVLLYDCTDAAREIAAEATAGKKVHNQGRGLTNTS